jgi:hypothetical protein
MTSLIEKALLIGFGLFTLILFFSIIQPFFNETMKFYNDDKLIIEKYENFINEVDLAVHYILANPEEIYLKDIEFPDFLNMSIQGNIIVYKYVIRESVMIVTKSYSTNFHATIFEELPPDIYTLGMYFDSGLLKIQIS